MSVLDLFRLDGKTAIVTGGGRGLGRYVAEALAEAGANVVVCSRKLESCREVADELERRGARSLALACDVADEDQVESMVRSTVDEFGAVDVVVNNSGATWGAAPEEMPLERFDQVMAVNVRGTFLVSVAAAKRMIERGQGGAILNVSSIAAFLGGRPGALQASGYSASKGALVSLTRDLAGSWAHHGIRVNAVAPGWFPTKMSRAVLDHAGDLLLSAIPMRRYGQPDDIKGVALFLASPASAYITGQTVIVDGGQVIW